MGPRVALVYPPYGPPNLPSLGLAILSAAAKARGFECRTFFWHYRFAKALPLPACTMQQKLSLYAMLTQWNFFPWNEWVFASHLAGGAGEGLADSPVLDAEIRKRLAALDAETGGLFASGVTGNLRPSQLILYLRRKSPELTAAFAAELERYDVVGIGTTFFQTAAALALARCVKALRPGAITVLGGANCDGPMGRTIAERFPYVDYVLSGEADDSFPEFLSCVHERNPVGHIPGLLHRNASTGAVLEGPPVRRTEHLDGLPVPDFDDYVEERHKFGLSDGGGICLPLESSRGCWWGAKSQCTFCGLNGDGIRFRAKTPSRFQQEIETVSSRYGVRRFFMADNILPAAYYRDFLPRARRQGLKYFYEIRPTGRRRQVADLAAAGVTMVQPGIESFSTKILSLMRKGTRGVQNVAFLKYAREHGLYAAYNLLAGFPGEDPSEYAAMARSAPALSHLQPPSGVTAVRFDRFSAYHRDPAAYGLTLRPHERYSLLYPFDGDTMARFAYVFEPAVPQHATYWQELSGAVARWRELFRPEKCTLTWAENGDDIVITDMRPGFGPRCYRLRDYAVTAFRLLDEPKALTGSAGATAIGGRTGEVTFSFREDEFLRDPLACLGPMIEAGLIYHDNSICLALPVESGFRMLDQDWLQLGI